MMIVAEIRKDSQPTGTGANTPDAFLFIEILIFGERPIDGIIHDNNHDEGINGISQRDA